MLTKGLFKIIKEIWDINDYIIFPIDIFCILAINLLLILLALPLSLILDILALPLEIIALIIYKIREKK